MLLNILGNFLCCYKPIGELYAAEQKHGDYKKLSRDEVFDLEKYKNMTSSEMGEDSKFILTLIER